jgi:hypothetical protein
MAKVWCCMPSGWNAANLCRRKPKQAKEGAVSLTPPQLSMLTEGIDWRMPVRTWRPEVVG